MSFIEHLDELRKVLIQSAIILVVLTAVCWFVSDKLLDFLVKGLPLESLYFTSPVEAFSARLRVSFVVAVMIAAPFVLFKIWAFIAPGLFSHERRRVYPLVITSSALFYVGVLFCYFVLIPVVLKFLLGFSTDILNPLISVNSYFTFVSRLCFTFGIVFQIPIVVLLLSAMGLVTPQLLLKSWRYGVVVIFVASAILTPPDAVSLVLMAGPIVMLYIGSILVAFVVRRRAK